MDSSLPRIACKTCEVGQLVRRRRYRMSGPVVVMGYLFIVLALLCAIGGTFGLVDSSAVAAELPGRLAARSKSTLRSIAVPAPTIEKVVSGEELSASDRSALSEQQHEAIDLARRLNSLTGISEGLRILLVAGLSILCLAAAFEACLVGCLLVMEKRVLQCLTCGAVTPAS